MCQGGSRTDAGGDYLMLLVLEDDLFFSERIERVARLRGQAVTTVGDAEDFVSALIDQKPAYGLANLGLATDDVLDALAHHAGQSAVFGPHVDGPRFRAARAHGITKAWANSKLVDNLSKWLESSRPDPHA